MPPSNTFAYVQFVTSPSTVEAEAVLVGRSGLNYWYDKTVQGVPGNDLNVAAGDTLHPTQFLDFDVFLPATNPALWSTPNDLYNLSVGVRACNALWAFNPKAGAEYYVLNILEGLGIGNVRPTKLPTEEGGTEVEGAICSVRVISTQAGIVWSRNSDSAQALGVI